MKHKLALLTGVLLCLALVLIAEAQQKTTSGTSVRRADGTALEGEIKDRIVVLLSASSPGSAYTYLVIPGSNVATVSRDQVQLTPTGKVGTLIVVDFGSVTPNHKLAIERFTKDHQGHDADMALDLPDKIVAVDLHDPQHFTPLA